MRPHTSIIRTRLAQWLYGRKRARAPSERRRQARRVAMLSLADSAGLRRQSVVWGYRICVPSGRAAGGGQANNRYRSDKRHAAPADARFPGPYPLIANAERQVPRPVPAAELAKEVAKGRSWQGFSVASAWFCGWLWVWAAARSMRDPAGTGSLSWDSLPANKKACRSILRSRSNCRRWQVGGQASIQTVPPGTSTGSPPCRAWAMAAKITFTAFSALRLEMPCFSMSMWTKPLLPLRDF